MKFNTLISAFVIFFLFGRMSAAQHQYPKARITAQVLDENEKPLPNANVRFVFCSAENSSAIVPVEGVTDYEGRFSGEGYSNGDYGVTIKKDGFYSSGLGSPQLYDIKDDHWLPWDSVVPVVLRAIGNPIPMYAKAVWIEIPQNNTPCGYDLGEGDWVSPYGKGHIADFVVTLERRDEGKDVTEAVADLTFTNPDDGIQEASLPETARYSAFKWPRSAPESRYQTSLKKSIRRDSKRGFETNAKLEDAYFFRVRTLKENGRVTNGLYGKIKGGLLLDITYTKTCKMMLTYYMNPTQLDRNIEWDRKHNLLKDVSSKETPREP